MDPSTLASCERYSPEQNRWSRVQSMNQKRAFASAVCLGDQSVYVFGGLSDFDATNSIE